MKRLICLLAAVFAVIGYMAPMSLSAESIEWLSNYDEAVQKAHEKHQNIILFFTGSGWCRNCQYLEQEILTNPSFINTIGNQFVFVKLDFPSGGGAPAKNEQLKERYNISGFPTIVVVDGEGRSLGSRVGYSRGGDPTSYANALKAMSGR